MSDANIVLAMIYAVPEFSIFSRGAKLPLTLGAGMQFSVLSRNLIWDTIKKNNRSFASAVWDWIAVN